MLSTIRKLSLSLLGIAVLSLMLGCAGHKTQESTGEYFDDSVITTKVKTLLFKNPKVSGFAISVDTFKRHVQLSGFVSTSQERQIAEDIARSVNGVKSVENNIIIK